MKVLRVRHAGQTFYGQLLLEENAVVCLDRAINLPDPVPLSELTVLPPLTPSKVVCVANNYRDRLRQEQRPVPEEPTLYFRPPSAVVGSGQPIILPRSAGPVWPGGELGLVVGRVCRDVAADEVKQALFGYCCANAATAVDLCDRDGGPSRAGAFDTFAAMGPWIETAVADPDNLGLRTLRNGRTIQASGTAEMLFSPSELLCFVSRIMTLLPGDVVLTGSPAGGEPLAAGDEVRVEIEAVGLLINTVQAPCAPLQ